MTSTDHKAAPGFLKTWQVAVRPFAYTASVFPVLLGAAMSSYLGFSVSWLRLAVTMIGVIGFHTAGNLLNDCFDYRRGLDAEVGYRSGAVVRGWLSTGQAVRGALVFLAVGILCGAYLAYLAGWVAFLLGTLGAFFSIGYTCPPLKFKYRGLGDLCVFLSFGVLPLFGSFWVQAEVFAWSPILWSFPSALLTVGILHANNWRDMHRDRDQGCLTLASMLGERGAAIYYQLLVITPFALVAAYALLARVLGVELPAPLTTLLVVMAIPLAAGLWRRAASVLEDGGRQALEDLDARTARTHMVFNLLLLAGFIAVR